MSTPIREAVNVLNDRLVLADSIGESFDLAGSANEGHAPAWVYVYRQQIEAIREAAEALETLLNGKGDE